MSISWMNSRNSTFSAPVNNMYRDGSISMPVNNMNRRFLESPDGINLSDDFGTRPTNLTYAMQFADLKRKPMFDQDIGGFNARRIKKVNIEMPTGNGYDAYDNTYNSSGYVNRSFEEEV